MTLHLPTLNAVLNATSAMFLAAGLFFIKRRATQAHKVCMLAAFFCSTAFLMSYLYYHFHAGRTRFLGEGWIRSVYFLILGTHTGLAVAIVPLILATLILAWREKFGRHARLARWTWPLWMYVSVTGVVIYWMLYH